MVLDLAFVAFLVINKGSIVLGHQEHHSFSLNLSQMCYLALILAIFPVGAFSIRDALACAKTVLDNYNTRRRYSWMFILLCGFNVWVTQFYSIKHPFLDSDNRHYGQKFYKYVISTHRRTWLAPLYTFCAFFIYELLKARSSLGQQLGVYLFLFLACSAATLVLTPLFELRYFMIPWTLLSLELQSSGSKWANFLYYGALNLAVMWVFVERPFVNVFFGNELSRFFW